MKAPERVTIALDEESARLFKKMKEDLDVSQSELMREALKFYGKHRELFDFIEDKKVYTHAEMLSAGEHVILDLDHFLLFLNFIDSHPDKEKFWQLHREVCQAHAEQFKHKLYNAESILRRLEACNLFKVNKSSEKEFTLVPSSESAKKFIRMEVEEIFAGMGLKVETKEDFSKLRIKVVEDL